MKNKKDNKNKKYQKNIYVLGYGKTAKSLLKKFKIKKKNIFDDFNKKFQDSQKLLKIIKPNDLIIPAPAIPPNHQIIKSFPNLIISEYDFIFQNSKKLPFNIWISGTNGKTTTTEMTTYLLSHIKAISGGNIGIPLSKLNQKAPIWVLETSSFMLHYSKIAKPNLYILLPITEDHIKWHGSFENYEQAKLKPLKFLKEGEIAIVPEKYREFKTNGFLITYKNCDDLAKKFQIDISKINFKSGFLLDSLLSLAVTKILFDEVDYKKLNNFKFSYHRQEKINDKLGRIWINDSKATNIESTISLLNSIDSNYKSIFLILGGIDKGVNWTPLFKKISEINQKISIFGIGFNKKNMENLAIEFKVNFKYVEFLDKAINEIWKIHNKETIAILSPASASFDQFKSYQDRGNSFKRLINERKN